ncbi:MAG: DUF4369 domain-containing protein [Muribaculaceae bacterium]|nr:DUF4369 domain-containing protein [Muribaculaceae bacterium]
MRITKYLACVAAGIMLWSCSGKNEWTVNGRIEGAEGQTMVLESSENGRWLILDSVPINDAGQFISHQKAAGYPDIYRLRLGDKTLYFPIDSIETVTVVAKADAFDHEYTISGSPSAEMLMNVDKRVMDAVAKNGAASLPGDSALKRELGGMLLGNPSGIVSYYIINKRIQGVPLFNPGDKSDLKVIGAVANAFNEYRPDDPRTAYLRRLFLRNRVVPASDTIVAQELELIDVDLMDNTGKQRTLAGVARDNKVVLLNFTAYTAEFSPALNVELNKIYERYHGSGLEIYQIGFDGDEYQWRQSAKNLPWVTVYNSAADGDKYIMQYNVGAVPCTFIIKNGAIIERVTDPTKLGSAVARQF